MTAEQMLAKIKEFAQEDHQNCACRIGLPLSDAKDQFNNCLDGYLVVCIHDAKTITTLEQVNQLIEKAKNEGHTK